jgi:hypothetical protein
MRAFEPAWRIIVNQRILRPSGLRHDASLSIGRWYRFSAEDESTRHAIGISERWRYPAIIFTGKI